MEKKINFIEEVPANIEELKSKAKNKCNADLRLEAIEELGKWKCRQSIDVLWHLMANDCVYDVQHAAFLKLQAFGEEVYLPKKKKGNLIKDYKKQIECVLKKVDTQITYCEFCDKLQETYPKLYDVYKHDKKEKFDNWLTKVVQAMPKELSEKISW